MSITPRSFTIVSKLSTARWEMARKKPDKEVERVLFTFAEAQEFLRVSHQTIYKLMEQGLLSHKIGSKRMFFKEDLLKWVREH